MKGHFLKVSLHHRYPSIQINSNAKVHFHMYTENAIFMYPLITGFTVLYTNKLSQNQVLDYEFMILAMKNITCLWSKQTYFGPVRLAFLFSFTDKYGGYVVVSKALCAVSERGQWSGHARYNCPLKVNISFIFQVKVSDFVYFLRCFFTGILLN